MIKFDCHAHVYERVQAVAGARYVPQKPAPLETWQDLQAAHGLCGGVIVQVSFLGTDNSQLLSALAGLNRRHFAGVAVVDMTMPEDDLALLAENGVRAVRWNLVADALLPDLEDSATLRFVDRLRALDMHIEVQLESERLAHFLQPLSTLPVPVVIDHLGLPATPDPAREPWLEALSGCHDRDRLYVKLSAPYRGKADPRAHLERLLELVSADRCVWGSDWPHTRHEAKASYAGALSTVSEFINDAEAVNTLYGLEVG